MNTTDPLALLQSFTGKEFSASPSPFMQWLKPVVRSAQRGKLSFAYKVRQEMTNPIGILHGGVTAGIIDDIIGATMFSLNEEFFYTTVSNAIDYFAPACEGEQIIADTLILKKGRQIVNVQCELWNSDKSRLLARGTSNLLKTGIKKPGA